MHDTYITSPPDSPACNLLVVALLSLMHVGGTGPSGGISRQGRSSSPRRTRALGPPVYADTSRPCLTAVPAMGEIAPRLGYRSGEATPAAFGRESIAVLLRSGYNWPLIAVHGGWARRGG